MIVPEKKPIISLTPIKSNEFERNRFKAPPRKVSMLSRCMLYIRIEVVVCLIFIVFYMVISLLSSINRLSLYDSYADIYLRNMVFICMAVILIYYYKKSNNIIKLLIYGEERRGQIIKISQSNIEVCIFELENKTVMANINYAVKDLHSGEHVTLLIDQKSINIFCIYELLPYGIVYDSDKNTFITSFSHPF